MEFPRACAQSLRRAGDVQSNGRRKHVRRRNDGSAEFHRASFGEPTSSVARASGASRLRFLPVANFPAAHPGHARETPRRIDGNRSAHGLRAWAGRRCRCHRRSFARRSRPNFAARAAKGARFRFAAHVVARELAGPAAIETPRVRWRKLSTGHGKAARIARARGGESSADKKNSMTLREVPGELRRDPRKKLVVREARATFAQSATSETGRPARYSLLPSIAACGSRETSFAQCGASGPSSRHEFRRA